MHEGRRIAINEEVYTDKVLTDLGLSRDDLVQKKAVEVGNIFTLGERFSEAFDLKYNDENGNQQTVFMGSYGIGPSRVMGLVAEHFSDEKGLVWPESVAPFKVYLVRIGGEAAIAKSDEVYSLLTNAGIEVLYDDREARPGEKFADSELMGMPYTLTVSDRLLDGGRFELKSRVGDKVSLLTPEELLAKLG